MPEASFQFTARRIHDPRCRMRTGCVRKATGVRAAIHRFHLSRLQSACDQHLDSAVAILWELEVPGSDLCAIWRLSAWWQFVAQSGKRIGARPLSRSERCDSKHACRRGWIALDG